MRKTTNTLLIVALTVFGLFSGWLIGASNTPVVSAFLPLLFGIATFFISNLYSVVFQNKEIMRIIENGDDIKTIKASITEKTNIYKNNPNSLIIIGSISLVFLVSATYIGVQLGIEERINTYDSLDQYFGTKESHFSIEDKLDITEIALLMRRNKVPYRDYNAILYYIVNDIIRMESFTSERNTYLEFISNIVSGTSDSFASDVGRGPASEGDELVEIENYDNPRGPAQEE